MIDQKPIGRTPRSNPATYTGLFDTIRRLFAETPDAKKRRFDAGWFSFNVAKGRCPRCEGVGTVDVELLFLPTVQTPCPVCHGSRYKPEVLEVLWNGHSIADVLGLSIDDACDVFADVPALARGFDTLRRGDWAISVSDSPPPNCQAAKHSASSSQPSFRNSATGTFCMFWMSPQPAYILPMWTG